MEPLIHLAIIWCGVFVAMGAAKVTKLTSVLWLLFVGAVLVNVGVLPVDTDPFIRGFAEVGIILIMFALGFEEDTSNFISGVKRAWSIALFGALAPFATAYLVADYFWGDTSVSLMCALAMTATAVSLTMVSLKSEGLHRSPAATGIMTSAVIDSASSLALVAVVLPLATGAAELSFSGVAFTIVKALFFFAIVAVVGAIVFPHDGKGWLDRFPFLKLYGLKHILGLSGGEHATLTLLTIAVLSALLAHAFGLHAAVGAYMAGLILREEYFHFLGHPEVDHYQNTKRIIDNVAFSWIGPVFFVTLGTKLVFDWEIFVSVIPETIAMFVGLFVMQIVSAFCAARFIGRFTFEEAMLIGFGMLGRAELAFVVMDIAYVQNSVFTTEVFYVLMAVAFWLNLAVPLSIRFWRPYYDGEKGPEWLTKKSQA